MDKATGPLAGVRVIDMSTVVLGPYAGQILGDLGADVIRLESPQSDMTRWAGRTPQRGFGSIFMNCNRNKRSLCIDLKQEGGLGAVMALVATADVFLHNVRDEAITRLGLDYAAVKAVKPDIVYVHAVGFGSEGPYAGRAAYDDLVQAGSGAASLNRMIDATEEARYLPTLAADKTSGLHAVYAVLAALFHRERSGEGQFVEVPMLESFVSFLMLEHLSGHSFEPPLGDYGYHRVINTHRRPCRTADGYVCIMPYSAAQWLMVLQLGGLDIAADDPRIASLTAIAANIRELYLLLAQAALTRGSDEWMALLTEADVPVMKVNGLDELQTDEHLASVDFFQLRQHPVIGAYRSMRQPVKFAASPASIRRDPPGLGEHNHEVLHEAGLSSQAIQELESRGVIYTLAPTTAGT